MLPAPRARLRRHRLAKEAVFLNRGQPGVCVGRADQANLEGIDAEFHLHLQTVLES